MVNIEPSIEFILQSSKSSDVNQSSQRLRHFNACCSRTSHGANNYECAHWTVDAIRYMIGYSLHDVLNSKGEGQKCRLELNALKTCKKDLIKPIRRCQQWGEL